MIYLLDTTTFSALMRRDTQAQSRLDATSPEDRVVVCSIVRGEILYGLERLPRGKRRRNLETEANHLFTHVPCIDVAETAGDRYASIKREAERRGTPLDENDLWIAATATDIGATLVTTDSDFQRLRGLSIEDWTST